MTDGLKLVEGERIGSFTPSQLEERRLTLGASEIPAVAGLSQYSNALTVWLSKMGQPVVRDPELEEYSSWGLLLEPAIAKRYADEHCVSLVFGEKRVNIDQPWMSATPDRFVIRPYGERFIETVIDRGLELKNRSAHQAHLFGENGTDMIPFDIAAQCHWSMIVTGLDVWDVAVLLGGNSWRWYRLHYDRDIATSLQSVGYDFWHQYVLQKKAPPIDGSKTWKEYLTQTFKKHSEVLLEATPEDVDLMYLHRSIKDGFKRYEQRLDEIENTLKARIADAQGLIAPNGAKATWKMTKDSTGIDYEAIARTLALEYQVPLERQNELKKENTIITKAGLRRFHVTLPKEK